MSYTSTILVTGASRGLGLATAKALATSLPSSHIICGYRSHGTDDNSSIDSNLSNLSKIQLDVTSHESVQAAVQTITKQYGKLDILINNAGVSSHTPDLVDNLTECISVNVLGAARVTNAFLPLLKASSSPRLIFITSVLGSIAARSDPNDPFGQIPAVGYRTSKAALNMLLACYSQELSGDGVKVFGICPGFLATELNGPPDMMRQMGAAEPETGAQLVVSVIQGERDADQGKVVFKDGVRAW